MTRDPGRTPYHDLARPEDDDVWADRWNEFVETVDRNLKLSGPKADCPDSAEAPAHAWYHATDEQLVYENGSNGWELIQRGSGLFLGNVYYDPEGPGPYTDLEEAVDAVPPGGTLYLAPRDFDLPTEGPIHSDVPLSVQGGGYGRSDLNVGGGEIKATTGTRLLNSGPDGLDTSVIAVTGEPYEGRSSGAAFRDFYVESDAENHPVISIQKFPDVHIEKVWANGLDKAPQVLLLRSSWFSRVYSSMLRNGREHGCLVRGTGYANEFYTSNVHSQTETGVGTETWRGRTIIIGGEHVCTGDRGTGISIQRPEIDQDGPKGGHLIMEPGMEHTPYGVRINDEHDGAPVTNVDIYSTLLPSYEMDEGTGVTFGNCENCRVHYPRISESRTIPVAEWQSAAVNCGIIADQSAVSGQELVDHGSETPYVTIQGTVSESDLDTIPTTVPVSVEHVPERASMAFNGPDQDGWSVAQTTPI